MYKGYEEKTTMSDALISAREFVSRKYLQAIVTSPELYLSVKRDVLSVNNV